MGNSSNQTFVGKIWQLVSRASQSRTISLLILLLIIASVPLTVFVAGQIQELRQRAEGGAITIQDLNATATDNGAIFRAKIVDNNTDTGDRTVALFVDNVQKQTWPYRLVDIPANHEISGESDDISLTLGRHVWYVEVKIGGTQKARADGTPIVAPRPALTYEIHGTVWIDTDGDGNKQTTEQGRDGITVTLSGASRETQTTSNIGEYFFRNLQPGNYAVTMSVPNGFFITGGIGGTTPSKTVTISNTFADVSWGIKPTAPGGGNGSIAFSDMTAISNTPPTFTYTIEDTIGANDVWPDLRIRTVEILVYRGSETTPRKYQSIFTYQRTALNNNQITKTFTPPSDASFYTPGSYRWQAQVLMMGTQYTSGFSNFTIGTAPGTYEISGSVLESAVGTTGRGKANVSISLTGSGGTGGGGTGKSTNTGINGGYSFNNLAPGNYIVTMSKPAGYIIVSGGNPRVINLIADTDVSWTIFQSSTTSPTPKPGCPVAAHYCSVGNNSCADSQFEPDNNYICGDGRTQTCCVLKGSPTPPPCEVKGCRIINVWNQCVDDDSKCGGGKVCKGGTCVPPVGGISPTDPPAPTNPIIPSKSPMPTATKTPTPSPSPTTSITPTPTDDGGDTGKHTRFEITTVLQAVGPLVKGNTNPKHKERQLKIEVFDKDSDTPVLTKIGTINYEDSTGFFKALVDMGDTLTTGDYAVKLKVTSPIGYLRKLVPPGIVHITAGETNRIPQAVPSLTLIVGDINNDNALDILDYNAWLSCFGNKVNDPKSCKDKDAVDLNDDGKTDTSGKKLEDYTWLFDSFQNQYGD